MIFTKEQIDEIRERLSISGRKDTQLPSVLLPMSGEESIALIQQGENRVIPIWTFYEEFARYIDGSERVDLLNVSRYAQQQSQSETIVPLTLSESIAICPNDVKRPGQILTFLDSQSNEWVEWQYKGINKEGWSTLTNWSEKTIGIVSVNSDGVAIDNAGRKWQLSRYIETYVTPASNWVYDGNSHLLATTNRDYVIYWADSPSALDSSTDTTIPTAKDAGTYTKYWKVKDTDITGTIQIVVSKKDITFASASASKTYDGNNITASTEVTITGAISGETFVAVAIGSAGPNAGVYANTINITSSPTGADTNYNILYNNGTLTINKVTRTLSWSNTPPTPINAGDTITSSQCVATPSPNVGTVKYYVNNSEISFPYTPASNVTIVAKVAADTNYTEASISAQVVVNDVVKRYAQSNNANAPVPTTDADIITPNSAYGTSGDFPNITSGYYTIEYAAKMAWFAIPKNKSITRIYSVSAADDWLNTNTSVGMGIFETTNTSKYKVYYVKEGYRTVRSGTLQIYIS